MQHCVYYIVYDSSALWETTIVFRVSVAFESLWNDLVGQVLCSKEPLRDMSQLPTTALGPQKELLMSPIFIDPTEIDVSEYS